MLLCVISRADAGPHFWNPLDIAWPVPGMYNHSSFNVWIKLINWYLKVKLKIYSQENWLFKEPIFFLFLCVYKVDKVFFTLLQ